MIYRRKLHFFTQNGKQKRLYMIGYSLKYFWKFHYFMLLDDLSRKYLQIFLRQ